ncbi:c-type cytochrome [Paracoccus sediminicola]|uniref:c-type cytochrome n=1 Tax=Paracoccus sediminicola TaxID=3017783 RepID=UPI0022F11BD4|nr:hypothetical protein [Paracoccus sediminicola]WBU57349.1 hypothetical protein PAF18_02565 [Paracoccus sediminicola]
MPSRPKLAGIFALILSLAVCPAAAQDLSPEKARKTARANYILHCSGCHGLTGQGTIAGGIPAFPDSVQHIADVEIGRDYILHVPGVIGTKMSDAEIAGVLNYILDEWGEGKGHFTGDEVTRRRASTVGNVVLFRREVVKTLDASGIAIADYPWP